MGDVLGVQMDLLVKNIITSLIPEISETHDTIFNSLIDYSNQDETNGRPIGLTSWNWIQIYMNNFPSRFYIKVMELGVDETSGSNNIERDRLVAKMHDIYNNLDKLCKIDEGVSGICSNLFETIAENLARLVVLDYTYSYLLDINADADFAIVHSSNMSKLCDTEEDAIATVADYEAKFRSGASPYDSPYYYALPELGKWIVKNKSTGKALKNIKYQKVVFN
jgi:hypothetical protein